MRNKIHHSIYVFSLVALAVSIPTSNAGMNLAGACLFANWVLEWNWKEKWNLLKQNKLALVLASFFLVLAWSSSQSDQWQTALQCLAAKLPLVYIPIIFASSRPLDLKWQRRIIFAFIICVVVSSILSLILMAAYQIHDIREGGLFISHIRFSICTALATIFSLYFFSKKDIFAPIIRCGFVVTAVWLTIYLFIIQVFTGILILLLAALVLVLFFLFTKKAIPFRMVSIITCTLFSIALIIYVTIVTYQYFHYDSTAETRLPQTTAQGNPYEHDRNSMIENGHKTGLYVCKKELATEWQNRSDSNYYHFEKTLIRYLNSKGLRKDAEGVKQLTDNDIQNIECGIANVDYTQLIGLKRVLYPTFFSITLYEREGITANSSFLQRVELWKAGDRVFRDNILIGCGLGDTKSALDDELQKKGSDLSGEMGCHNQFLTYGLTGGSILIIAFLVILFAPFFDKKRKKGILYLLFFTALVFSFFSEDTLETVAGLNLFLFFNSFFLFCMDNDRF